MTWRWSNLFIGWAPLPSNAHFVSGVGVRSIPSGFPNTYWVFIEYNHFYQPRLSGFVLPVERNLTILSAANLRSDLISRDERIFNQGIPLEEMRRRTGHSIVEYKLRDADRATNTITEGEVLRIYRPTILRDNQSKPRTVVREEEIRERLEQPAVRQKEPVPGPETEMKKLQEREVVLLRESQKKEIDDLNRRIAEARKRTQDSKERAKIESESQTRIQVLKKKHQEEEAKLKKRQEEEAKAKSSKTIKKKKKSP